MAGLIDKIVSHECIPLFYTDMVGINSMITEDKKELAFELANILVSEEVLTDSQLFGQLINNHFDHHCSHWIIDLFHKVSVLSVYSIHNTLSPF